MNVLTPTCALRTSNFPVTYTVKGSIEQPQAQHPPTSTHYYESTSPPEVWDLLVSDASWYHHREAQNHSPEHSRSPFLAGAMIFPPPSGMLDQSSSNNWKLISFNTTWLHHKKKTKKLSPFQNLNLSLSLLPLLACTYLNNAWDLVLQALPLSVRLFKINRFMYSQLKVALDKSICKMTKCNVHNAYVQLLVLLKQQHLRGFKWD